MSAEDKICVCCYTRKDQQMAAQILWRRWLNARLNHQRAMEKQMGDVTFSTRLDRQRAMEKQIGDVTFSTRLDHQRAAVV